MKGSVNEMSIYIDENKCIMCGLCMNECAFNAIELTDGKMAINEKCTFCSACLDICADGAIIREEQTEYVDLLGYNGIWVYAEIENGSFANVTYELLGEAVRLADKLNVKISTVVIGSEPDICVTNLFLHGSDIVYIVANSKYSYHNDEIYTGIMCELIQNYKPEILLFGATVYGRSLAPRIASRLRVGLTADCTEFDIDEETGQLLQTRPAFGGNLMATICSPNCRPQMATVRPNTMKVLIRDKTSIGEVIRPKVSDVEQCRTVIRDIVEVIGDSKRNLSEADIIVAVGRGVGKKENLDIIKKFANRIGGSIAASRAIVDEDMIDYAHQVGQTGKTVAPKVYIALGISGAIQHLAGMSSSNVIIAVNKDAQAPIFDIADYGIVCDMFEILPYLIE